MTRLPLTTSLFAPALLVALSSALGACTTDTKVADAHGADASTTSAASTTSDVPADAGTTAQNTLDAGLGDGGTIAPDPPTPDAGIAPQDVKLATTSTGDKAAPNAASGDDGAKSEGKSTPFDRILAKPKAVGGDVEALKAAVEKKTGQKVALVRRTAGKWLLLQFAPTSKGRDEGDQRSLVDALKSMDEFASVEGDRLMKVKQP